MYRSGMGSGLEQNSSPENGCKRKERKVVLVETGVRTKVFAGTTRLMQSIKVQKQADR